MKLASSILLALALGLAGCGHGAAPTATTVGASAVASLASVAARDKAASAFLAEYQGLSWQYSADQKKALLVMLGNAGSAVAVAPLTAEYQGLSWQYSADTKQLLLTTITHLMQTAQQPCSAGLGGDVQDQTCQTFLSEYQGLSWQYSADQKRALLTAIAATGSDKAVDALTSEYQGLSWQYSADQKNTLLAALSQLLALPPSCGKALAARPGTGPRQQLIDVLKAELASSPTSAHAALKKAIAKLGG